MRLHNFNAGPAVLPLSVLETVREELVELPKLGLSVMEMSHRSKEFDFFLDRAENGLRKLLGLSDDFAVLFLGGGASLQFSMAPMNLLTDGARADYLVHGSWGVKALKEAQKIGAARQAASTQNEGFRRVPLPSEINLDAGAKYVHFTSNETIEGVQWPSEPQTGTVPLVCDASSDIMSRPIDIEKYGLIYAGAQKNIGPSGVTVVIVRRDWIAENKALPTMLSYATHAKERSLYNTPNTFGIYMIGLVCEWIEGLGGLAGMQKRAAHKSNLIYDLIDASDFYRGFAAKENRSQMNVTFRLPSEELETKFAQESQKMGMIGLKGHRSVGGLRASIYNALEPESVQFLVDFMREFERENG
ncbi:phosphoserine aminotransferase apoenzyme [Abditibacterium utsteinense]|uniref:Phosphoserine aminotransferase n=1 Tax=Abditibacterium utsteinense TaxID=1960156 RepID=A0A2S8SWD4_9BACT|nr:3-phosphoserine/phosphohydroxythreonine transaminase [Abditibacterium utsteinense]PQV65069.1 phosphoserine aminotransferase apoenzyme [Abditibacterium utsteinense]